MYTAHDFCAGVRSVGLLYASGIDYVMGWEKNKKNVNACIDAATKFLHSPLRLRMQHCDLINRSYHYNIKLNFSYCNPPAPLDGKEVVAAMMAANMDTCTKEDGLCVIVVVKSVYVKLRYFISEVMKGDIFADSLESASGEPYTVITRHKKNVPKSKAKPEDSQTKMAIIVWKPSRVNPNRTPEDAARAIERASDWMQGFHYVAPEWEYSRVA